MKQSITEFSELEFTQFVEQIFKENIAETDDVLDELLEQFESLTAHPDGSDLFYYPDDPADATPERITQIVKEWRTSQGLPCFKQE